MSARGGSGGGGGVTSSFPFSANGRRPYHIVVGILIVCACAYVLLGLRGRPSSHLHLTQSMEDGDVSADHEWMFDYTDFPFPDVVLDSAADNDGESLHDKTRKEGEGIVLSGRTVDAKGAGISIMRRKSRRVILVNYRPLSSGSHNSLGSDASQSKQLTISDDMNALNERPDGTNLFPKNNVFGVAERQMSRGGTPPSGGSEVDDALKKFGASKDNRVDVLDEMSGQSVYDTSGFRYEFVAVRHGLRLILPYYGLGWGGPAWLRENAKNSHMERLRLRAVENVLTALIKDAEAVHAGVPISVDDVGVVIDVGSTTGTYGMYAATYGLRSYMIEPNPLCVSDINKAIDANALGARASVLQAVASEVDAESLESGYAIDVGIVCRGERLTSPFTARLETHSQWTEQRLAAAETVKRRLRLLEGGDTLLLAENEKLMTMVGRVRSGDRAPLHSQPTPFALSDMRVTIPVSSVRIDTLIAEKEIKRVALVVVDVGGMEPAVLLPLLEPARNGIIRNIVVRLVPSAWPSFGFTDRTAVAAFVAELCRAGGYYVTRVAGARVIESDVAATLAAEIREMQFGDMDVVMTSDAPHPSAGKC